MPTKLPQHKARKRFGQNFLNNDFWIEKIADAIRPLPGQDLVEIGPGQAALTQKIIDRAGHLTCVEIDRDLARWLRTQFPESQMTLIEADALTVDWRSLAGGRKLRICGNLPYNISSPLLFALFRVADCVEDQHFMLQKEVVDRMCAAPGSKAYGRLSVMLQLKYTMVKLFDVPPEAFTPAPKVMSSVVRMTPRKTVADVDENLLENVVAVGFSMRRKTLRNVFAKHFPDALLTEAGIDPGLRAEAVGLELWIRLTNLLKEKGIAVHRGDAPAED